MNIDKTIIQRVLNKAYNNYLNTALVRLLFITLSIVTYSFDTVGFISRFFIIMSVFRFILELKKNPFGFILIRRLIFALCNVWIFCGIFRLLSIHWIFWGFFPI